MSETAIVGHRVLSSSVARLISQGARKIMITSSGPGEGKSTIAAMLGRNLARSGRLRIALVDVDTFRPTLHDLFQLDRRQGLGELLDEVYHAPLSRENAGQFGIGDWVELIRVQSKTGRLQVSEGSEEFFIIFDRGRVSIVLDRKGQGGYPGEILEKPELASGEQRDTTLQSQMRDRLHRILNLRQPRLGFSEAVEVYPPAAAGGLQNDPRGAGIDRLVADMVRDYAKQPYLSSQVLRYLKDTSMENLKILTCGGLSYDLCDPYFSVPFSIVIDLLARSFDVVLVDSPPVTFDSPTGYLAASMDGILLVVKANGLDASVIQKAKEQLLRSGANLLGVVLNQADLLKDEALPYYQSTYR